MEIAYNKTNDVDYYIQNINRLHKENERSNHERWLEIQMKIDTRIIKLLLLTNVVVLSLFTQIAVAGTLLSWGVQRFAPDDFDGVKFKAITAGAFHSLAIKNDGSLVAWEKITTDNHYLPLVKIMFLSMQEIIIALL